MKKCDDVGDVAAGMANDFGRNTMIIWNVSSKFELRR